MVRAKRRWYCLAAPQSSTRAPSGGPVLACCVLGGLAESIGGEDPAATALVSFDRLRLRAPPCPASRLPEVVAKTAGALRPGSGWPSCCLNLAAAKPLKADEFAGFPYSFWTMTTRAGCSTCTRSRESGTSTRSFTTQLLSWGQLPDLLALWRPSPQRRGRPLAAARRLPARQFHRARRRRRRRANRLHAVCNRSSRSNRGSRRRASRRKRPATASGREGKRRRSRRKLEKGALAK